MGLGEILDRAFQIYRGRFLALATIAAAPAAGMLALHFADDYWWHLTNLIWKSGFAVRYWGIAESIAYGHISVMVYAVFTAAIIHQASTAIVGDDASAMTSLRFAFGRWPSFLWIGVLNLSVVLIAAEATAVGALAGLGSGLDALGFLNGDTNWAYGAAILAPCVGGILLLLWLAGCFGFSMPACAMEDARGRRALARSWRLSRNGRWRLGLAWLLLFVLRWLLTIAIEWAFRWCVTLVWEIWRSGHHFLYLTFRPAYHVLAAILSILLVSLYPIALTLLYYDQRIRKEGFDIEWMMAAAGMDSGLLAAPESGAGEIASVPEEGAGA
jgi:hypothetical protein